MKYLPFENITYKTELKKGEVIKRLSNYIEPEKMIRFPIRNAKTHYEGRVNNHEFEIKRIIDYRNAWLPRIEGTFHKDLEGTIIRVNMRLGFFVIIFMIFWCGAAGLGCIVALTQLFTNSEVHPIAVFATFGMLLFAYVLTMAAFKKESSKSKKDLEKLFEASIIDEK